MFKEDWERSGYEEPSTAPWFQSPALGVRAGGSFYMAGYGDRISTNQPMLTFVMRANLPWLLNHFVTQFELRNFSHSPVEGKNPALEGLTVTTTNYGISQSFGYEILSLPFLPAFGVLPRIGFGYMMQSTKISGNENTNLTNGFPFATGGIELLYAVTTDLTFVLDSGTSALIESGTITYQSSLTLGANYYFH